MTTPAEIDRQVGLLLRHARLLRGWSLHQAAAESGGRFKASALGTYERGERRIAVSMLYELADLYQAPVGARLPPLGDLNAQDSSGAELIGHLPPDHRELIAALIEQMFIDTRPTANRPRRVRRRPR